MIRTTLKYFSVGNLRIFKKGTKSLCSYVCNVIRIPSFILIPISRCFCDLKLCAALVATITQHILESFQPKVS